MSTLFQNGLSDKLHAETKEHLCSGCVTFLMKTGLAAFTAQRALVCWVFYSNLDSIFSHYFLKTQPTILQTFMFCSYVYGLAWLPREMFPKIQDVT